MRRTLTTLCALLGGINTMAANPGLFFTKEEASALREAAMQPGLTPARERILREAEAYCDPTSAQYADLNDPFQLRARQERVSQSRHDALVVHQIGRILTQRMEALGFAYQLTGHDEFGDHGAAFLARTTELYPVSHEQVAKGFAGGRGDIMRGLALGYDWLSERLGPEDRRKVAKACADYVEFFLQEFEDPKQWFHKVHNFNGVNGGAAGCLALALRDEFPDRHTHWVSQTTRIIERWLDTGFDKQGAYVEGVSYSGYGLSNTILFAHALRRTGDHDLLSHPVFVRLAEFYALSLLPGEGVYDARNDSNYSGLGVYLLGLCNTENGGLYRWLWERTGGTYGFERIVLNNAVAPVDPMASGVPTARHFEGRGLCIWRTGWTASDVMFATEAGPYYPVTHNQGDKGHFTLYGLGQRWAVDSGYANEHSPKGRGQTPAHSCVLIDGKGQALSGAGWGTNGRIASYTNSSRCGYARADCTEAYNRNNRGIKGAGVQHAVRHSLFVYPTDVASAYAVVLDDIAKDGKEHEYAWQMMLDGSMTVCIEGSRAVVSPPASSGGGYIDTPPVDATGKYKGMQQGTATPGQCVLRFDVPVAGEYTVWARVRATGPNTQKSDSFFVRMDDGEEIAWHMQGSRAWTWGRVTSGVSHSGVPFRLNQGTHRLTVGRREAEAQMDCLWLTTDADADGSNPDVRKTGISLEAETGDVTGPMEVVRTGHIPRMVVCLDATVPVRLTTDEFVPDDYHKVTPFPRLRGITRAAAPEFMAVLLPLPASTATPNVTFTRTDTTRAIRIDWNGQSDVITWPRDGSAPSIAGP